MFSCSRDKLFDAKNLDNGARAKLKMEQLQTIFQINSGRKPRSPSWEFPRDKSVSDM